jgi:hypothetical protein
MGHRISGETRVCTPVYVWRYLWGASQVNPERHPEVTPVGIGGIPVVPG